MRILHIVHQYPPEHIGGTELYTQFLARRQAIAGHIPAVLVPTAADDPGPEPAIEQGVRIYRRPVGTAKRSAVFMRTFWNRAAGTYLEDILDREQPDLVHIQHLMGLPATLVQVLSKRQVPYLITLHDYYYACANAQLLTNYDRTICAGPDRFLNCARCVQARGGQRQWPVTSMPLAPLLAWRHRLLLAVLNGARAIIAPSDFVRAEYERLGCPPGRITVIRHGIQLPTRLPSRSPQPEGRLRVVYLGGITWQKGVHVLIEAANACPPGVQVTIYGDLGTQPDYAASLIRRARQTSVSFVGQLQREQVWPTLADADVVVVPSLWHETSSLIAAEAQAAGAIVVASDLGALPERVTDGQDGLLFPAGDAAALRRLLQDLLKRPERVRQLQAGIKPVRRIEEHVNDVEELYRTNA